MTILRDELRETRRNVRKLYLICVVRLRQTTQTPSHNVYEASDFGNTPKHSIVCNSTKTEATVA